MNNFNDFKALNVHFEMSCEDINDTNNINELVHYFAHYFRKQNRKSYPIMSSPSHKDEQKMVSKAIV